MAEADWHKCKFIESGENLKPLVKKRFGREPSSFLVREIVACLQQGRLFYQAATTAPLEIRPLQQFYGMLGFSKALIVASQLRSLSTLRRAHGVADISSGNARIADIRVKILNWGTFQDLNDVVADLTRLCYIDYQTRWRAIYLPSAKSSRLRDIELSLRDLLSRIPGLGDLYRMTFGEEPRTDLVTLETGYQSEQDFRFRIDDSELFGGRDSLQRIVTRWRSRFPFLKKWRLSSAQQAWGNSIVHLRNVNPPGIDEFSEEYLALENASAQERPIPDDRSERFSLQDGLEPLAGGFGDHTYAISPVHDAYISEFSIHYLGLFLLSSLVRYRPQGWAHAISRSVVPGEPADDKALSLIERFLDLNQRTIPEMVVRVLNPYEDYSFA